MNNVAQTILSQLGGNRFCAMTGAKGFVYSANSLSFKVGRNAGKVTHVRVVLDASDTYSVTFFAISARCNRTVREASGIYADNLQSLFTHVTGLAVRL
jgi:hypothetical protein